MTKNVFADTSIAKIKYWRSITMMIAITIVQTITITITKSLFADTPIAKIKYWRSLPADNIQLGDDVYFECEVLS